MATAAIAMFALVRKFRKSHEDSGKLDQEKTSGKSAKTLSAHKAPEATARKKASAIEKKAVTKTKQAPKKMAKTVGKQPNVSPISPVKNIMQLYDSGKDGAVVERKSSSKSKSKTPETQSFQKILVAPNILEKQDVMFGGLIHL